MITFTLTPDEAEYLVWLVEGNSAFKSMGSLLRKQMESQIGLDER